MASSAAGTELPRWADVVLIPLINLALALLIAGCVVLIIGENPLEAMGNPPQRCLGKSQGLGLPALLRHEFYLHRSCGRRRLSRRSLQYRRRRPGLYCWARRRHGRALSRLPTSSSCDTMRHYWCHDLRRGLGFHPRLSASQARQPHRHHDDHVQFHRRQPDDLSSQ